MKCTSCGELVDATASQCRTCGTNLLTNCTQCGFGNSAAARFCGGCALRLATPQDETDNTAAEAADGIRNPAPDSVSIAASPVSRSPVLEAGAAPNPLHHRARADAKSERKQVTVMFADIRSSFALTENRDPEQARELLESVIAVMVDAVHQYGGTVAQILGDGIMALFGAPIAHEDHAVRACNAALAVHEAILARDWSAGAGAGKSPQIRIGMHSGDVVISAISSDMGWDYRAVGATAHMAARMEQLAEPGTTRITAQTAKLADGLINTESLGPTLVKGVMEPQHTYLLTGRTHLTPFQATVARGLSPFVGRASELNVLLAALDDVAVRSGQVVAIDGEPGVGKSRLAYEFLAQARTQGSRIIEASALAFRRTPYIVIERLLRTQLNLPSQVAIARMQTRLDALCRRSPQLCEHTAALASLLNIPVRDASWNTLDPTQRRSRTIAALRATFASISRNHALILFCEDLQWFDSESLSVLQNLITDPPNPNILFLVTRRIGTDSEIGPVSPHQVINLGPLSIEGSRGLIATLVGDHPGLAAFRLQLLDATDGNPFFIEETLRSLAETSALIGSPGAFAPGTRETGVHIPPSVDVVISARIDRLSSPLRDIVMAAAVIGDDISEPLLQAVLDVSPDDLSTRMAALAKLGMIYHTSAATAPLYRFRHFLIRDVSYGRLLSTRRRELHGRVVHALETLYPDRIPEHVDRLAEHAFKAQLWEQSVRYHLIACPRAVSRSANRYAVSLLDRGLESLAHLPGGDAATANGIDLRLDALAPLLTLGERERMLMLVREAELMARSISDQDRLGAVYSQLATGLWMASQHDLALEAAQEAYAIGQAAGNFSLTKAAQHNLGMVYHAHGNFAKAIETCQEMLTDFTGDLARERFGWVGYPSVFCRTFLGSSLTFVGRFNEALQAFSEAVQLADELDHPYSRTIVREEMSFCYLLMGQPLEAVRVLEAAQQICMEFEVQTMLPAIAGRLAMALAESGRADEAINIIEHHLDQEAYRLGGQYAHHFMLLGHAVALLYAGRARDALKPALDARAMTEAAGEQGYAACALLTLGDVYSSIGQREEEAIAAYKESRTRGRECGMLPIEALCEQGLGKVFVDCERWTQAHTALTQATSIYDRLGLPARLASVSQLMNSVPQPSAGQNARERVGE